MDVRILNFAWAAEVDTLAETHPCFLDVSGCHSHEIICVESLRMLPVSSPTKNAMKESIFPLSFKLLVE